MASVTADDGAGRRGDGREATTAAMLDAAEELFSEQGFSAVSVRSIAEQAGVSHALVHRYLGTKEAIYQAVLRRNEEVILAAAGGTDDLVEAVSRMLREGLAHHRRYLRLVTHSALDGYSFATSIGRFPASERLIELAERQASRVSPCDAGGLAPRFAIAAIIALYLGWLAVEPWLLPATGLERLDDEAIVAGLECVILRIIADEASAADT